MTEVTTTDPMIQLAALLIDADETRSRVADAAVAAAHREQIQALDEQVSCLHEAADAVRTGAWIQGLTTVAGAGFTADAHVQVALGQATARDVAAQLALGKGLEELSPALGQLFGTAASADANADAKQAEQRGADAAARADGAREERRRAFENADRTLATLQSTLESTSQGNLAVIANV